MVEPRELLLSFQPGVPKLGQDIIGGMDSQRHWLKSFLNLATRANPNVIEWLFVPEDKIRLIHPAFKRFLANPTLFLSKDSVYKAHLGFARDQLVKMVTKNPTMGKKRRDLIEQYGFDVKFASHGIRLLHQLRIFSIEGRITYPYPAEVLAEVMSIKRGEITKDQFLQRFHDFARELDENVLKTSVLPERPDIPALLRLTADFYEEYYFACEDPQDSQVP